MVSVNENHVLLQCDTTYYRLNRDGISFDLNVKEGQVYRFTGEIKYSLFEKDNAAFIAFEFDSFPLNLDNCNDFSLTYSERVGAFTYLNTLYDTNTYDIEIHIPKNVKKIKVKIQPWYSQEDIYISKMIFFQEINPEFQRVFESCKQIVFSRVEDLKIMYDEPVLYRYIENDCPYEFLAHFKQHSEKLVLIGTAAIKEEVSLPVFQRHSQVSKIPESCIIIHDPTLYINREILVGWYQGGIDAPVVAIIVKLLETFLEKISLENKHMLFYGGSAAGHFSLSMAGYFKGAIACVTNPQTNVLKYTEKMVEKLLDNAFEGTSIIEAEKKYVQNMSVIELYKTLDFFPKVWYRQNRLDFFHYKNHMLPLLEYYIRDTNVINSQNNLIFELYSHEKGHNAVADLDDMIQEIYKAYEYFDDKGL